MPSPLGADALAANPFERNPMRAHSYMQQPVPAFSFTATAGHADSVSDEGASAFGGSQQDSVHAKSHVASRPPLANKHSASLQPLASRAPSWPNTAAQDFQAVQASNPFYPPQH